MTLQYVCNQRKLKIPWNLVAQAMGPSYSGGAIVQHLAKVRKLRVEEGLEVPPPLTKGGKLTPAEPKDDKKGSANKRARLREMVQDENNDEDSDDLEESSGSEDYYGRKKRKPKTQGKSRPRAVTEKERTSVSNAGRKIRGSNAASRATASDLFGPEDEDCQIKKHETSFEDSSAASQQNYAAGDSMWDLDSDDEGTEMEFKRSRSASPTEDAENPSKVLVLNIGVAGFQKLGLAGAKGKSPANRYNLQDGKGTYESLSYEGTAPYSVSMI